MNRLVRIICCARKSFDLLFGSFSSQFTMTSNRFIKNPFPDYDGQDLLSNTDNQCLREDIAQSIKESITKLYCTLEKNLGHFDANDKSLYTGQSGLAILYLKIHETQVVQSCKDYLQLCNKLLPNSYKIKNFSFLCGEIGPLAVSALVEHKRGNVYEPLLRTIANAQDSVCNIDSDEILYGRAGYLYALLLLRKGISNCDHIITNELIRSVITAILNSGIQTARRHQIGSPLVYFWYNEPYVGLAHGYAGIM